MSVITTCTATNCHNECGHMLSLKTWIGWNLTFLYVTASHCFRCYFQCCIMGSLWRPVMVTTDTPWLPVKQHFSCCDKHVKKLSRGLLKYSQCHAYYAWPSKIYPVFSHPCNSHTFSTSRYENWALNFQCECDMTCSVKMSIWYDMYKCQSVVCSVQILPLLKRTTRVRKR